MTAGAAAPGARGNPFNRFARGPNGERLRAGRVETFFRAWKGRTYVRVYGGNREPSWLFFETVLPLLGILAYLYIYTYLGAPHVFVSFVVLGGAMVAFWLSVLWGIANHMYWEKQSGNLELYFIAPVSPMAVMLGMATGSLVNTGTRATASIAAGVLLFNAQFDLGGLPAGLAILVITLGAVYFLGMMFASLFLVYGREGEHLAHSLQEPVFLAAGFYYPLNTLPLAVQVLGSFVPLTFGLDAMRQLLVPGTGGVLPLGVELVILVGMLFGFAAGARFSLGYMEYLAKREGRLTLRWQ